MNTMLTRRPEREQLQRVARLLAPVRNRYFYGKLLDAEHLELEQRYFLQRERLINRLTLGTGVLCGLHVRARDGQVAVSPGVAVDGFGREIVVTETVSVDPWSLDAQREHDPDEIRRLPADSVVLLLCYHECDAEPAPVLVADCELREECVPSVVRERYSLRAVDARTWRPYGGIDERVCAAIFGGGHAAGGIPGTGTHDRPLDELGEPGEVVVGGAWGHTDAVNRLTRSIDRLDSPYAIRPHSDLRDQLCELLSPSCGFGPECVPIALVTRGEMGPVVDECAMRTTIYSNTVLLDLILCLAERVEECCDGHRVRLQAPVITDMYPAPAETVKESDFTTTLAGGAVSLTFDHDMDPARLAAPEDWLRVLLVATVTVPAGSVDHSSFNMRNAIIGAAAPAPAPAPAPAAPAGPAPATPPADTGDTTADAGDQTVALGAVLPVELADTDSPGGTALRATYAWTAESKKLFGQFRAFAKGSTLQVAVVARSDDITQIADTSDPPELLDPDFAGTGLPHVAIAEVLWLIDGKQPIVLPLSTTGSFTVALPAGTTVPQLPSGNGIEGGLFHAWFGIDLAD